MILIAAATALLFAYLVLAQPVEARIDYVPAVGSSR
jgi:hypothetical protein